MPLFTKVIREYWLIHVPISYRILAFVLYQTPLVLGLIAGYRSWLFFALSISLSIYGFKPIYGYLRVIQRGRKKWANENPVIYRFTDEFFESYGDVGKGEHPWTGLKEITKLQHAWMLMFTKELHFIVPTSAMDEELMDFIDAKLAENRVAAAAHAPLRAPKPIDY